MSGALTDSREDTFLGLGRLSDQGRISLAPFTARLCEEVAERVWWARVLEAHELDKQNGLLVDEAEHQRAIEECDSRLIRLDRARRCWEECYKAVRGASERKASIVSGRLQQASAYAADRSMERQATREGDRCVCHTLVIGCDTETIHTRSDSMGADNTQSNEPETESRICQECKEPVNDPDAETSVVTLEYKNG